MTVGVSLDSSPHDRLGGPLTSNGNFQLSLSPLTSDASTPVSLLEFQSGSDGIHAVRGVYQLAYYRSNPSAAIKACIVYRTPNVQLDADAGIEINFISHSLVAVLNL